MRSKGLFVCSLLCLFVIPATSLSQENKKPGSTVDTWRDALPSATAVQPATDLPDENLPDQSTEDVRKTLLTLQQRWMEAIKVRDADTLAQIISSEFSFTGPGLARTINRTEYLKYVLTDLKLMSFEFNKTTVRLFGRTAIVSSELKQKSSRKDVDSSGSFLVTEVWVKLEGTWKLVNRHESVLN